MPAQLLSLSPLAHEADFCSAVRRDLLEACDDTDHAAVDFCLYFSNIYHIEMYGASLSKTTFSTQHLIAPP